MLSTRTAHAGLTTSDYANYCSTGAFATCASIEVSALTTQHGTLLTIRIRNLQGTLRQDNTGGSSLTSFAFTVPCSTPGCADLQLSGWTGPTARGTTQRVGPCAECWDASLGLGGRVGYVDNILVPENGALGGSGIEGCDTTGLHPSYFRTCGSSGWVEMTFSFVGRFQARDVQLAWGTGNATGNGGCSFGAFYGGSSCQQATVTPEPATLLLLGTGLAGMAGLRRRRLLG